MKPTRHRGGLPPNKFLSPDELQKVVDYASAQAEKLGSKRAKTDHLIVEIFAGSGIRRAELAGLQIQDLPHWHLKPVLYIRDGKGNVSRPVDISTRLQKHITRYVEEYRKDAEPDEPLFATFSGAHIGAMTIHEKITRIGRALKLKTSLHPHKFRHSYAIKLYGLENDLLYVSQQLGHSSIETTTIYAKTSTEAARRQVEQM